MSTPGAAAGTHQGSPYHRCHTRCPPGPRDSLWDTGRKQSAHRRRVHRCCRSCRSRWSRGPGTLCRAGWDHTGCLPAPHLAHPPPCTFPYHRARGGAGGFAAAGGTVRAAAHTHCYRWRRLSHTLVPRRQGRRSSCTRRRPGLDPLHWAHRLRQSHTAFPCTLWLGTGRGGQSQSPGLRTAAAPTGTSPHGCAACSSPHTATSVMGALLCTFTGPGPLEGAPASPGTFPHRRTFSIPLAGEGPPAPQ